MRYRQSLLQQAIEETDARAWDRAHGAEPMRQRLAVRREKAFLVSLLGATFVTVAGIAVAVLRTIFGS